MKSIVVGILSMPIIGVATFYLSMLGKLIWNYNAGLTMIILIANVGLVIAFFVIPIWMFTEKPFERKEKIS